MSARLLYQNTQGIRIMEDGLPSSMVVLPGELFEGREHTEGYAVTGESNGEQFLQMLEAVAKWGLKHGVPAALVHGAVVRAIESGDKGTSLEPAPPAGKVN